MAYECEFDFMCGREFATMDERERHEREDHEWSEEVWECCGQPIETDHCQTCEDTMPGSGCYCDGVH
jgi:hypothetical protein